MSEVKAPLLPSSSDVLKCAAHENSTMHPCGTGAPNMLASQLEFLITKFWIAKLGVGALTKVYVVCLHGKALIPLHVSFEEPFLESNFG